MLLTAAPLRAQSVLALPHAGDADLTEERGAAHAAAIAALREQGLDLVTTPSGKSADAAAKECKQVACAPSALAAAGAQVAVAVAVWKSEPGAQVHVTLVDARGDRFSGVARIEDGDAAAAGRKALLDARGLQLLGPGPWIVIEGQPEGAIVLIDGRFVGTVPYRGALASGDHALVVKSEGFSATEQRLTAPLDPTATLRLDVSLRRAEGGAALGAAEPEPVSPFDFETEPERVEQGSPWNFVMGGVLAAGGVALATIEPLQAAAKDGDCVDASCDRIYQFGGDSVLKIAAGAALVGAGVAVMIWQPLRVETQISRDGARLAVTSRF